jgi:hypothetical protein
MIHTCSLFTNTPQYYKKWFDFFEKDLENIYSIFSGNLEKNGITHKDYPFEEFCKIIYKKSSKRIPKY